MQITVYPHSTHDTEVQFTKGTVVFDGGDGYIAKAVTDDGVFLAEGSGATEADAVLDLQQALIAGLEATAGAKSSMVAAARKAVAESRSRIKATSLSHLSDGEFGAVVRKAMQMAEADDAAERKAKADAAKAMIASYDRELLAKEQVERKSMVALPGFTLHGIEVPALDLAQIDGHQIADGQTLMVYSALNVLSGGEVLDRDTTTYLDIAALHTRLRPNLTAEQQSKVQTLVDVLGMSVADATAKVLAL